MAKDNITGFRHLLPDPKDSRSIDLDRTFDTVLAAIEALYPSDSPIFPNLLSTWAYGHHYLQNYRRAIELYELALNRFESILGPNHLKVADILREMGAQYALNDRSDFAKARPLFERALSIYENQLRPDHEEIGACLAYLSSCYRAQNLHEEADALYERIKRILGNEEKGSRSKDIYEDNNPSILGKPSGSVSTQLNEAVSVDGQNEGRLPDAVFSDAKILDALERKGVGVELRQQVAAALIARQRHRPLWSDRDQYEELAHLNAPRFLKHVYSDLIDANGNLSNENVVRLHDPELVRVVQTYMNERLRGRRGFGDAKGLSFEKKDARGRPKKPARLRARRGPSPS
jgi:tetratricopeptide (TPR) repeat protein